MITKEQLTTLLLIGLSKQLIDELILLSESKPWADIIEDYYIANDITVAQARVARRLLTGREDKAYG